MAEGSRLEQAYYALVGRQTSPGKGDGARGGREDRQLLHGSPWVGCTTVPEMRGVQAAMGKVEVGGGHMRASLCAKELGLSLRGSGKPLKGFRRSTEVSDS